jgi:hypothetical protein
MFRGGFDCCTDPTFFYAAFLGLERMLVAEGNSEFVPISYYTFLATVAEEASAASRRVMELVLQFDDSPPSFNWIILQGNYRLPNGKFPTQDPSNFVVAAFGPKRSYSADSAYQNFKEKIYLPPIGNETQEYTLIVHDSDQLGSPLGQIAFQLVDAETKLLVSGSLGYRERHFYNFTMESTHDSNNASASETNNSSITSSKPGPGLEPSNTQDTKELPSSSEFVLTMRAFVYSALVTCLFLTSTL